MAERKGIKRKRRKQPRRKIKSTLNEVENDLKSEAESLLQMKELIQKQIRILKAEDVTIQRLIEAHVKPPENHTSDESSQFRLEQDVDTTYSSLLPELNLNTGNPEQINQKEKGERNDGEEFDSDDDSM